MGPKTVRRLAVVAVVLVLGIVSIFLLQRRQVAKLGESNLSRAEQASKQGDFKAAEEHYLQHIQVFPDDLDAKLKYAEILARKNKTPARTNQAMGLYDDILKRDPGRLDVRRLLAELQATSGSSGLVKTGRGNLTILLNAKPKDGELEYLMGRCEETLGDAAAAVESYKNALAHGAPEKSDAYRRMAGLLRKSLNQPGHADEVIEQMVKSDPKDFRGYLERGRYRKGFDASPEGLKKAAADFDEARRLAPKEASIYVELALLAQGRTPPDLEEAVRVLREGLAADPGEVSLYVMLANIERAADKQEAAEQVLRQGIEQVPDSLELRLGLSEGLAIRGATVELLEQIEQMQRIGLASQYADYFTAYYHVNMHDWVGARKILVEKLQPLDLSGPLLGLRSAVSELLARCYAHLGDPERGRAALASAMNDNPNNLQTKLKWIADLVSQGKADQAIGEYRALLPKYPQIVRLPLVELLMGRNQRLPESQRDWKEVEGLIALAAKDAPSSPQPALARAELLQIQKKPAEAKAVLDEAIARGPKDPAAVDPAFVSLWTASAGMVMRSNHSAALKILDEAERKLGDRIELRQARARVLAARGGPDAPAALVALTEDLNAFPKEQRVTLLEMVAAELAQRNHYAEAARLTTEAAALAPNDIQPRLRLLTFGLQSEDKALIEQALAEIKRIDGADSNLARYAEIEYKIWQARTMQAKTSEEKVKQTQLRSEARTLLAELSSRRPDWSVIPLTTAKLEEEELKLATEPDDVKRRQSHLADLYGQAIEMGQRNFGVVRRATEMLVASGRTAEVTQLWNKVPGLNSGVDLSSVERLVLDNVIRGKDHESAINLIREQVAARPNDFNERLLLVSLLLKEKRVEEAEVELNKGVALDRTEPDRWIALIKLLVGTKQMTKAEQAASEIAKAVAPDRAALAVAQCADLIGQGYQAAKVEAQRTKWFDEAKKWYEKAQAAKPGDVAMKRTITEFLLRTGQLVEVEKQLNDVLDRPADFQPADLDWAKRTLALTFVARSQFQHDYPQAIKALDLFAPPDKSDSKSLETPEDLRTLARVYEAQKIPAYRKQAVEILEKLKKERLANIDDQVLLARIYYASDEWDKAQSEYRRLLEETKQADSPQALNFKVTLLTQYASQLIDRLKPDGDPAEAQGLIDQLKEIQPAAFNVMALQARLDKSQGKNAEAVAELKKIADRPGLSPDLALATAGLAEDLGEIDLAQRLFKLNATASSRLQDRTAYAAFLGRQGRIKEALDVCEPLWTSTPDPRGLVSTVLGALFPAKAEPDPAQVERVGRWVERSIQQNPKSTLFLIALGNIRERQKHYADAEKLYRQAIDLGGSDVIPLNNLAWIMALQGEKGATALDLINKAIALRGPMPEFLDTRAVVYLNSGESQRAVKDLEDAVAIDPSAVKYFHLAQAYLEASNKQAAKQNLEKARAMGLAKGILHPLELDAYQQVVSALD